MKLDVDKYKSVLDTGKRGYIVDTAKELVKAAGGVPKAPRPTNVSANHGADNSAEKARFQKTFNDQALGFTKSAEAYNKEVASGGSGAGELGVMVEQLQDLATADANLTEIERIEKGDAFGTGGGLPTPGVPPWAVKMQDDITAIRKVVESL